MAELNGEEENTELANATMNFDQGLYHDDLVAEYPDIEEKLRDLAFETLGSYVNSDDEFDENTDENDSMAPAENEITPENSPGIEDLAHSAAAESDSEEYRRRRSLISTGSDNIRSRNENEAADTTMLVDPKSPSRENVAFSMNRIAKYTKGENKSSGHNASVFARRW